MSNAQDPSVEAQIDQWRSYLQARQAIEPVDVAELEDHLREQIASLQDSGLDGDEAFLVAVKRMGRQDALSREFAREHSDRLWKQLVMVGSDDTGSRAAARTDALVAFALAIAAAILIKVPSLFGLNMDEDAGFYARNLSLFVLPLLTGYFAWKRKVPAKTARWLGAALVTGAVFANVYPFTEGGSTEVLTAVHLPIALWVSVVGVAYAANRWRDTEGRMDFVRFSGELFIYYVLIALGGGVLMGLMALIFGAIGVDVGPLLESWVLPCGAVGAVLVASWLVEAKQSVIENMTPVLTKLFTPLFAALLVAFLGTMLWTRNGVKVDRDVLIVFDLLLVVVLALVIYSVSARDRLSPPGLFDVLQTVLVISALLADAVALWAIAARITEFGLTPNRVAALGMNVILLVNLVWTAVLYVRFLRGHAPFSRIERWQTGYIPVYAAWAAFVVVAFPPLFGYI